MKSYKVLLMTAAAALSMGLGSCVGDLDTTPIDENIQLPEDVLDSQDAYEQLLAKCYQGLSVSSSHGPDGDPDISGVDGGFGQYVRALFNMQELTTDEATCCWTDIGLQDLHNMNWTTTNQFISSMYYRVFYQVSLCNEFIRRANSAALSNDEFPKRAEFVAEARALRALSYYHAIDIFGNVPFATEGNTVGSEGPAQISRADLYAWLVEECTDLLEGSDLAEAKQNIYGRSDKGMVRMILAKVYLNAEVWGCGDHYADCAALCKQIIADYQLHKEPKKGSKYSAYAELFLADNHLCTSNVTYNGDEIIFVVPQDGVNVKSYGCTNFLIFAGTGDGMDAGAMGISSGWGGLSLTKDFSDKFDEATDARALFFPDYGKSVENVVDFKSGGYKSMKFKNINSDGTPGQDTGFVDTDFPMFRSADAYLMLAECAKRGGAAESEGMQALNDVRERAGLATVAAYSLQDVLDERARELYWECHRRQDLIRFGQFTTGDYCWQWKGAVKEGRAVEDYRALMPLVPADINASGKLTQNPGY
ncbi:MAG: RagB/SusD family nutrient uptake outer membrane protein [Alistipes senegalensis]|nr:RagB/SusD family nutrient uptake outer membrane protein [Bacteroides cellulosilyticus]MCM1351887.1 RagB/SusD family nutrient uptake outer membrane protein [Alistipes senegalensis]